jgi:uncharacterized protein (TIGR03437 family)
MNRVCLALAAAISATAWGAAPSYSVSSIVNASNYTPGPFAPNSILALFGTGLARAAQSLGAEDIRSGYLPTELNYTRVYVDNSPAPLFYVSDTQINFLLPSRQATGNTVIRVAREGLSGPEVTVSVVDAAPALFTTDSGYAIATDAKGAVLTAAAPAQPGDVIVIWATGLGKTAPNPATGEIPHDPALIAGLADLHISLAGAVVDPTRIFYAGLCPGYAGLYQINIVLPPDLPIDPEIRLAIGSQSSPPGLKLPVRPVPAQPDQP